MGVRICLNLRTGEVVLAKLAKHVGTWAWEMPKATTKAAAEMKKARAMAMKLVPRRVRNAIVRKREEIVVVAAARWVTGE